MFALDGSTGDSLDRQYVIQKNNITQGLLDEQYEIQKNNKMLEKNTRCENYKKFINEGISKVVMSSNRKKEFIIKKIDSECIAEITKECNSELITISADTDVKKYAGCMINLKLKNDKPNVFINFWNLK